MKTNIHFWPYLAQFFLERKMFQTKFAEKVNTLNLWLIFFFENYAICEEILKKKIVVPDRPQVTIWRMRIACRIPNTTNAHSEYVTLIAFILKQWLQERPTMWRLYVHCLLCYDIT